MFCRNCGTQRDPASRFCPSCGTATGSATPPQPSAVYPPTARLTRSRNSRVIAGVCSGLAEHYGWDLTIIRLVLVLCVLFAGTGVLAYIIAWIVIPEAPYELLQPGVRY